MHAALGTYPGKDPGHVVLLPDPHYYVEFEDNGETYYRIRDTGEVIHKRELSDIVSGSFDVYQHVRPIRFPTNLPDILLGRIETIKKSLEQLCLKELHDLREYSVNSLLGMKDAKHEMMVLSIDFANSTLTSIKEFPTSYERLVSSIKTEALYIAYLHGGLQLADAGDGLLIGFPINYKHQPQKREIVEYQSTAPIQTVMIVEYMIEKFYRRYLELMHYPQIELRYGIDAGYVRIPGNYDGFTSLLATTLNTAAKLQQHAQYTNVMLGGDYVEMLPVDMVQNHVVKETEVLEEIVVLECDDGSPYPLFYWTGLIAFDDDEDPALRKWRF